MNIDNETNYKVCAENSVKKFETLYQQQRHQALNDYKAPNWIVGKVKNIPKLKVSLARLNTPIDEINISDGETSFNILVKRDDLTGSAEGGNKIRKLEFLLADALSKNYNSCITAGGIQSNHCRATAVCCRRLGIKPICILRIDNKGDTDQWVGNLGVSHIMQADIIEESREAFQNIGLLAEPLIKQHANMIRKERNKKRKVNIDQGPSKPYCIPIGGSNALGTWGYIEMMSEMDDDQEYILYNNKRISDIVVAIGSGGTAAGLAIALVARKLKTKLTAISVCDDKETLYDHIKQIYDQMGGIFKDRDPHKDLNIIDSYIGEGYALNTKEELCFIQQVAISTGIIVDPVYSGKALRALVILLSSKQLDPKHKVMFVHTGGLFGLWSKEKEFKAL